MTPSEDRRAGSRPADAPPRRVRQDHNPLARIVLAALQPGMLVDRDWRIRVVNPAFTMLTGWAGDALGKPCADVIRCQDDAGAVLCQTTGCPLARTGAPEAAAVRMATATGTAVAVAARAVIPELASTRLVLWIAPAAPPTTGDAFLADVAHKLRNRMNTVQGFIELVATGQAGRVGPRQRQMLSYAHASAVEMMEYIENLLFLSRADAGEAALSVESVQPAHLLEEVEQHVQLEAAAAQVRLERAAPDDLPELHGDRARIRQALLNLTLNAIKFTPPGGDVRLTAAAADDALIFTVADTGIGIALDDLPHIFERDYLSDRMIATGKSGGGLGLATALAIARQHGGELTCASVVDAGATFTLRLPR